MSRKPDMARRWENAAASESVKLILHKLKHNPVSAAGMVETPYGAEFISQLADLVLDEMKDRGLF